MPIGIYLHIPFCAAICNYCNFNRGLHDDGMRRRYVDALVTDIRRQAAPDVAADTIFFGGGTPSLLEAAEVAAIPTACRESFAVSDAAEITLEANPESSSAEVLEGFRAAGINRLSYGVQSFHDAELKRLYLVRDAQNGGWGGRLFDVAIDWLLRDGPRPVWIGVYSENHGAQRFYERRGWTRVGQYHFPVGSVRDLEWILRRG